MKGFLVMFVATFCLHETSGDVNISQYIYWKKQDIIAWHQFFPSRALEEERQTLVAGLAAVQDLASGINESLSSVVTFQAQELITAQQLVQGTDAQGCVEGIADFMPDAIAAEVESYLDCAGDSIAKLLRLNATWAKTQTNYLTAYQRALKGIDLCARNYPNKNSFARLVSCVESMNKNYFVVANATQNAMFPSPSMTYFQTTLVQCASISFQDITMKGAKFLRMLVDCAKLTPKIDPVAYAAELGKWQGYYDTLYSQISNSQWKNYDQVWSVEVEMERYYALQKQALEQYVIESRGFDFYLNKTYLLLDDYYNTVVAAGLDNPEVQWCADDAKAALDLVAKSGANKSLSCDLDIVNNTQTLISSVVDDFLYLNNLMPSIGNVALLQCFSQGYIFAPNTISDCFDLVYSSFDVEHSDRKDAIVAAVSVLEGYVTSFFNGTSLPCGGSSLRKLLLGGNQTLYDLQRCLYIGSGTTYDVSTPHTITSTASWASTTPYYNKSTAMTTIPTTSTTSPTTPTYTPTLNPSTTPTPTPV